jgi:RNA polymerase sigma factor (sigma-70 family)
VSLIVVGISDEDLLVAAAADAAAFGEFYERHERRIAVYFMARTRNAELAADLTSETFAVALLRVGRYRSTGSAVGWLFGIARNLWRQTLRDRRIDDRARRRLGITVELTEQIIEHLERVAGDQQARIILEDLPREQADALRARFIDGDSYAEIAGDLRCSPSVVRQRVSRGLGALRARKESS